MKTDDALTVENPAVGKHYVRNRGLMGIFLFFGWLVLFFMGLSVPASKLQPLDKAGHVIWDTLWLYALTFTPTNTALLAALAGVIGGLSSNLSAVNEKPHIDMDALEPDSFEYRSLVYMTEHPVVSMFRGFLAYLILVAGSYVASFSVPVDASDTSTPILGMSAASYFKFAVTVSLLSYLVGYDPTQLQRLVSSLNIGGRKATDFAGHMRIKDGRRQLEGEFAGKAVPASPTADPVQKEEDPVPEKKKAGLNGKAKSLKHLTKA
ncbi:hypothetical protein ACFQ4C_12875 [Larkinella insperata]|uniref:Uncharacterized protein n=1 Tax=Larkinella insperata TaxID=332158 RepID=A0ABW3Q3H2_9BACT|nr:hypothetical protein [Larkinella insperata]